MSYIGIKGAERLDKSNSSLCLLEAQAKAVHMLGNGADMHSIKLITGWETGVDGKWRYEVADPFHTTTEIEDHIKKHFGEPINIRHCMHDITLLTAYPAFERLRLFALYSPTRGFAGYFDPGSYGMLVCMGTASSLNIKQKECCYMKCSILFKKKRILLVVEVAKIDDTIGWQVKSKPEISVLDIF